ncbi:TadE/TadG family type IV pilus assembly protein [Parendozoicomonas haliclonae]|uniref:VWFA domain-containing protein n=2 Tax=Parendozoicomonas haliclonae TaxID=1960125 RepID=A0A1X7AKY9_9GAMM|nr:hypothetical protein EHSB41UT_02460 [Parendozoicomonas haliclonae]
MLMLPVLAGVMLFVMESAQLLRARSALGDASDAAVLAVSTLKNDDTKERRAMARSWMEEAVTGRGANAWLDRVDIDLLSCFENPDCDARSDNGFEELRLVVSGQPPQWFQSRVAGYSISGSVAHSARARRYVDSGAKDVYFVADFSSSMDLYWAKQRKITMLRNLLNDMAQQLEDETEDRVAGDGKNTIAVIPYSTYTMETRPEPGKEICSLIQIPFGLSPEEEYQRHWDQLDDALAIMFQAKPCHRTYPARLMSDPLFFPFFTVPSTTSAQVIKNQLAKMKPDGETASYEGIIRAAQEAMKGKNPIRTIIVLSDGADTNSNLHRAMVEAGYCDTIREVLENQDSYDGKPVRASIAVVSFSYALKPTNALAQCADKGKVYTAENVDDLRRKVVSIIKDDSAHLYRKP